MNTQYAFTIIAPEIEPKFRHAQIMDTFDGLKSGEQFKLINDHDPKPLHYQFMMEREGLFTWEYLQEGPTTWEVSIGKK